MQAIGDRLREARMRQKIDIADVEAATKIRAKYLRALENEEFGLLPGPTFVKTFLRTYAEYLGLDATLLVEEYRVAHEPRGEEFSPIDPTASRVTRRHARASGGGGGGGRRDRRPRVGPPGPGAVFAVVLVLLLAVILVLGFTGDDGSQNGTTPQQARQPDESQAARAKEQARKERAARKKKERAAAERRASTVKLRLAPAEPTYACVVDGAGNLKFGGTLSTPRSFNGKHLRINLGKTSMQVTVSGKRLAIPPGSNPVGYDLRAGRKPRPLPLGQRPNC